MGINPNGRQILEDIACMQMMCVGGGVPSTSEAHGDPVQKPVTEVFRNTIIDAKLSDEIQEHGHSMKDALVKARMDKTIRPIVKQNLSVAINKIDALLDFVGFDLDK